MRQLLVPHWPRKLHRVKAKLYDEAVCSKRDGIAVAEGSLLTYTVLINVDSIDRRDSFFAARLRLETLTLTALQLLPPLPVEAEMSITGESQPPTVLGAEMDTVGISTLAGADTVTLTGDTAAHDAHHRMVAAGHEAFNCTFGRRDNTLPGTARFCCCDTPPRPPGLTTRVLLSAH